METMTDDSDLHDSMVCVDINPMDVGGSVWRGISLVFVWNHTSSPILMFLGRIDVLTDQCRVPSSGLYGRAYTARNIVI